MFPTQIPLGGKIDLLPSMSLGLEEDYAGGTTTSGGETDKDFELFPDLQGLKRSVSRCLSNDSGGSGVLMDSGITDKSFESVDEEFVDYLSRGSDCESSDSHPPVQAPRKNGKVKVTPVLPPGSAVVRVPVLGPGKAFLVDVNDGRMSMVNPLVLTQPTRSWSSALSLSSSDDGKMIDPNSLCMSKNAVAARENRQKKKQHTEKLEKTVEKLTTENKDLQRNVSQMSHTVKSLKTEVDYLRSVLANESTLSALLKKIPMVSGVNILSSEKSSKPNQVKGIRYKRKTAPINVPEDSESDSELEQEDSDKCKSCSLRRGNHLQDDCQKGSSRQFGVQKLSQLDHSYASDTVNNMSGGGEHSEVKQQVSSNSVRTKKRRVDPGIQANQDTNGGVCLHVSGNNVSLEFCVDCSRKSRNAVQAKRRCNRD